MEDLSVWDTYSDFAVSQGSADLWVGNRALKRDTPKYPRAFMQGRLHGHAMVACVPKHLAHGENNFCQLTSRNSF